MEIKANVEFTPDALATFSGSINADFSFSPFAYPAPGDHLVIPGISREFKVMHRRFLPGLHADQTHFVLVLGLPEQKP